MSAHRFTYDAGKTPAGIDPGTAGTFAIDGRSLIRIEMTSAAGSETRTLANATFSGQIVTLIHAVDGGDIDLTVTDGFDEANDTSMNTTTAGDFVTFISVKTAASTIRWRVLGFEGFTGLTEVQSGNQTIEGTLAVTGATTHTGAVTNSSTVATTGATTHTGGERTLMISLADANTTILAANSGKVHLMPNVSADRIYTLPANASGLYYEFWSTLVAADGHDIQIIADNAADFYKGSLLWEDSDLTVGPVILAPNGTDDHTLNILLPIVFYIKMYCDGTNWFITGNVFSAGIPTFT